jgi:hypothetical protein
MNELITGTGTGASLNTLQRVVHVVLADGILASDYSLKNLNQALGEAQFLFGSAIKSEENKWGGYRYTPLENIIKAVRPALIKHHLTVSQFPLTDLETRTVSVITRLVHWDSGEWIQHTLELPGELALGKDGAPKFNQQTIGGTTTYAQKYAYKAILGVPDAEEMIDSTDEKGDLPARTKSKNMQAPVPAVTPSSPMRTKLFLKADEYGWSLSDIKQYLNLAYPEANGSTSALTEKQLEEILALIASNKPETILNVESK